MIIKYKFHCCYRKIFDKMNKKRRIKGKERNNEIVMFLSIFLIFLLIGIYFLLSFYSLNNLFNFSSAGVNAISGLIISGKGITGLVLQELQVEGQNSSDLMENVSQETDITSNESAVENFSEEIDNSSKTYSYLLGDYGLLDGSNELNVSFVYPSPINGFAQSSSSITVNISSHSNFDHYTFLDFDNSLLLWMRMDDLNASGDPLDLSNYRYNGSKKGGAVQNPSGAYNSSFNFPSFATSAGISLPSSLKLSSMKNWTLSMWIKTVGEQYNLIYLDGSGSYDSSFWISVKENNIPYEVVLTNHNFDMIAGLGSSSNFPYNIWTHVAFTYNGSNFTYYRNGVATLSQNLVIPTSVGSKVYIGGVRPDSWNEYNLDETLIFNRTLMPSEILSLFNASANNYYNSFDNLSLGNHTFKAYSVDSSGNRSETALIRGLIGNSLEISAISPIENRKYYTSFQSFNVSTNRNVSVNYTLDNGITNYTMLSNASAT